MISVRIADLKARLSEHLRRVRRGESLTVMDRETPIARILPYAKGDGGLVVRSPLPSAPPIAKAPMPPPLKLRTNILVLLREEREDRP